MHIVSGHHCRGAAIIWDTWQGALSVDFGVLESKVALTLGLFAADLPASFVGAVAIDACHNDDLRSMPRSACLHGAFRSMMGHAWLR